MEYDVDIDGLLVRHAGLIHRIASQFEPWGYDRDEVEQIGRIAIWKALEVQRQKPQYAFTTLLGYQMKRAMAEWYPSVSGVCTVPRFIYDRDPQVRALNVSLKESLDEPVVTEEGKEVSKYDLFEDPYPYIAQLELQLGLAVFWDYLRLILTPAQYRVVESMYRGRQEPLEAPEVAQLLGLSPWTVRAMHQKAIKLLREHCRNNAGFRSLLISLMEDLHV